MQIAIPLFDRVTALDAIGPYEVLSRIPGAEVRFVTDEPGTVRADTRMLSFQVEAALEEVPAPEVVVFPGGYGTRRVLKDERWLRWLREVHAGSTWTTSVCTGALVLGAAGILDDIEATTHWLAFDLLASFGARPVSRRVVEEGRVITCAGVSAGIDMALMLAGRIAGEETAQQIQLYIEYDPEPPFDAGSIASAPEGVIEQARARASAAARRADEEAAAAAARERS